MAKEITIRTAIDTAAASNSVKDLRNSIKELKAISLSIGDTSSKDFKRVASAIGDAGEKLDDLRDDLAAFKGSTLEKFNAGLQVMREKFANLEIGDVAKQFKTLGEIIAANPLLFLAKIVIELVQHFDELKAAGGVVGEVFTLIGNIITDVVQVMKDLTDAIGATDFATQEAAKKTLDANKKILSSLEERYNEEIKLAEAAGKSTVEIENQKAVAILKTEAAEIRRLAAIKNRTADESKLLDELIAASKKERAEIAQINAKAAADYKKEEEEKTKKLYEESKKRIEIEEAQRRSDLLAANKATQDIVNENKVKNDKILSDEKAHQAALEQIELDAFLRKQSAINARLKIAKDEAQKEKEKAAAEAQANIAFTAQLETQASALALDTFNNFLQQKASAQAEADSKEAERSQQQLELGLSNLDKQLASEQITQAQYDEAKNRAIKENEKKQHDLQKAGFERYKKFQLAAIAIDLAKTLTAIQLNAAANPSNALTFGATGISQAAALSGLAIASSAAQAALVANQKPPAFATGGYVQGPGTGTSDSINARLSNGESVINANSTAMFGGLLSALNQMGGGKAFQTGGVAGTNSTTNTSTSVAPIRAYVVESEITSSQKNISRIIKRSTF